MKVSFYNTAEDAALKFAVVLARTQTGWVFCRHRERTTWESPGGHREPCESIEQAARRELWEETGASSFILKPVCACGVCNDDGCETLGMLYLAHITAFDPPFGGMTRAHACADSSFSLFAHNLRAAGLPFADRTAAAPSFLRLFSLFTAAGRAHKRIFRNIIRG